MHILLISPPHKNNIIIELWGNCYPPLGLLYLAAYLKRNSSHQVTIIDSDIERLDCADLRQKIGQLKPDLVGIQVLTLTLIDALKTAAAVKDYSRNIPVVLGGPHVTIYPQESLMHKDVDYIVRGEGEIPFKEMLNNLGNEARLREVSGIGFKNNGRFTLTEGPFCINDLNSLPFPDRTFSPFQKYKSILTKNFPVTSMMTSRGCPYNCIYCNRMGKKFRAISESKVLEEIEHCLSLGIKEIFFHDDTFTTDKKRIFNICELINKRGLKFNWAAQVRVDTVNYDLLSIMKKAGCHRINFGVESGNPKMLRRLRKGITLDQVETAFRHCRELKIKTLAYFMIGLPGESRQDIMETISFARKLGTDYARFALTTPYPGTDLYREALDKGIIKSDVWSEFARNPKEDFIPPLWTENLSREELIELLNIAHKKFYFSPGFMIKELLRIRSVKELAAKMRAGLKYLKK